MLGGVDGLVVVLVTDHAGIAAEVPGLRCRLRGSGGRVLAGVAESTPVIRGLRPVPRLLRWRRDPQRRDPDTGCRH